MPGLRVAIDVTPLLGVRGGVSRTVQHLLDALPDAAPDVEVVPYVLSRRARKRAFDLPVGTVFLDAPAGLAVRAWGFTDRPRIGDALGEVDVVHGTNFVVPPNDHASTVTIHDTWCLRNPGECSPAVRPYDRAVRKAVERGAWLHVSTQAIADEVQARYLADRVAIVPFGVPPISDATALPEGVRPPYVLAISTDEPRKRHEHLVRAFRSVAPWEPDLQLVLAGADGGATADVLRAVKELPEEIRARVVRVGTVDDDARAALLRQAKVLAYPSADEGFGLPVLEAMSVGVPVVATNVGGIPEVADDAALLIDVDDDPGPLVDALRRLVTDRVLRGDMRARGRERARHFSWRTHARGMAQLWQLVAEAGT